MAHSKNDSGSSGANQNFNKAISLNTVFMKRKKLQRRMATVWGGNYSATLDWHIGNVKEGDYLFVFKKQPAFIVLTNPSKIDVLTEPTQLFDQIGQNKLSLQNEGPVSNTIIVKNLP